MGTELSDKDINGSTMSKSKATATYSTETPHASCARKLSYAGRNFERPRKFRSFSALPARVDVIVNAPCHMHVYTIGRTSDRDNPHRNKSMSEDMYSFRWKYSRRAHFEDINSGGTGETQAKTEPPVKTTFFQLIFLSDPSENICQQ